MKQHITIEQLNELSNEGKEKLRKWCDKKDYIKADIMALATNKPMPLPLLNIGQMIEFLQGNLINIETIEQAGEVGECPPLKFMITSSIDSFDDQESLELCDALWEAVKEVLKRE